MSEYRICENCGHPIYQRDKKSLWWHFRKNEGCKHGTTRMRCFQCECNKPIPQEEF